MADPEESFMESVSNYMSWTDRRGNASAVRINYPAPEAPAPRRMTTREMQAEAQIAGFRTVREWDAAGRPK